MNITQYIDQGFSIALGIAILWTVIFSMTNKPSIRGYRNLGLLACYILLVIYLFVIGWRSALFTWFVFGRQHSFAKKAMDSKEDGCRRALSQTLPGLSSLCSSRKRKRKQSSFVFIRIDHCCCSDSNIVFL